MWQSLPLVFIWQEDRTTAEREEVLPVATEYVGRFKFYTAKPSATWAKLQVILNADLTEAAN